MQRRKEPYAGEHSRSRILDVGVGVHSTQYSHIVGLSSHFYVYAPLRSEQNEHPLDVLLHIGAGPKVFHPPMSKLMWI